MRQPSHRLYIRMVGGPASATELTTHGCFDVTVAGPFPRFARTNWFPAVLLIPFLINGLVDLPRMLEFGSVSVMGGLTVVQVLLAIVALALAGAFPRRVLARLGWYGAFLTWMFCRSMIDRPDQNGWQNAFVYVLFGVYCLLAGTLAAARPTASLAMCRRGIAAIDVMAIGLVALNLLIFGLPPQTGEDSTWFIGPRAVALLAIAPICWHLAGWCHGRPHASARALAWIVTVMASMSRTATAVALGCAALAFVAQAWTAPRRFVRQVPLVLVGVIVMAGVVLAFRAQFHERFLEGYNNVEVAGVSISTSGRDTIWATVIASGMRHPLWGAGLGSSQAALFDFGSDVGHPHNDYLRVWHDGGVPGLVLILVAFAHLLIVLARQWRHAITVESLHPEVHLAAVLTLIGVLLTSTTDNGFVYVYVMGPAALLTGLALGMDARDTGMPSMSAASPSATSSRVAMGYAS